MIPEMEQCRWSWHMDRCSKSWKPASHLWQHGGADLKKMIWRRHGTGLRAWKVNNFRCTEAGIAADKRLARSWLRWIHLDFIGCSKHHENLTIEFLAGNYPKSIYGMAHFEFGLNLQKQGFEQGVYSQIGQTSFKQGANCKNRPHQWIQWVKLPQKHI